MAVPSSGAPHAPASNDLHVPVHPVRFVTAAALFDGHDAAINIMRRILQAQGAEVVHLGHDRSVAAVVDAVLEEDAQGVAISSYQGGHVEYFEYLAESLDRAGAGHVKIYGGGGGVIVPRGDRPPEQGRGADLLPRGRPAPRPARDDQRADQGLRHRPGQPAAAARGGARGGAAGPRPGHHLPAGGHAPATPRTRMPWRPRPAPAASRCSGSPAPAAPASRRSPTSWSAGSAPTSRTSSGSRCSRSTRPGGAAAARCWATASG